MRFVASRERGGEFDDDEAPVSVDSMLDVRDVELVLPEITRLFVTFRRSGDEFDGDDASVFMSSMLDALALMGVKLPKIG